MKTGFDFKALAALLSSLLTAQPVPAQQPPASIAQKTPAPTRTGVQAVAPGKAKPASAPKPKTDEDEEDSELDAPKGGAYELDLDTGDISPEDEADEASSEGVVPTKKRSGFGISAGPDSGESVGDAIVQTSAYRKAKEAEAARNKASQNQVPPEAAVLQGIMADNQRIERELRAARKEAQALNRQTQQSMMAGSNRDAKTTDAAKDVEFAEAMASRRASSLAREKGLSLIPAMRTIELRLMTFADSEQPGKFKALVTDDVWDASFASVGIPRGTLARGFVEAASGDTDSRIRMTITEFILPSGDSVQLRVPDAVTDELGAPGPKAKVDHHWGTRTFSAVAFGFIGAVTGAGARSPYNNQATFGDVLQNNLAGQMGQIGQSAFQNGMQAKPTVQLRHGSRVSMTLGTNLYLIPWERKRPVIPAPNLAIAR